MCKWNIKMKKLIILTILSGCSITTPNYEVNKTPLPEVSAPTGMRLSVCKWDIPRDMTQTVVDNTTECKEAEKSDKITSNWFKKTCVKNPVDEKSNLLLGFDEENYLCFIKNQEIIREVLKSYDERLTLSNKSR